MQKCAGQEAINRMKIKKMHVCISAINLIINPCAHFEAIVDCQKKAQHKAKRYRHLQSLYFHKVIVNGVKEQIKAEPLYNEDRTADNF